jgi:glycosyltransferase involved in cell wall biosynthesis
MSKAVVAIPTYRRPSGLLQLLQSLAVLSTTHQLHVIVGDNDGVNREGVLAVETLKQQGYRWPLEAIVVTARGISQVRNALIEASLEVDGARHVLMLDDDEIASPQWLDEMIRRQVETGADIVGGRVNRQFDGEKPSWAEGVLLLSNKTRPETGIVDLVDSTANILFARPFLDEAARPLFDISFGLTGGGDKEALTRLKRAGARFAWSEAAVVWEQIPASRLTEDWVLKRAYRVGNSDMRVLLRHHSSWTEVGVEILKALAVLAGAPALLLRAWRDETRWIRARMMIWRAAGKLAAFAGLNYREYLVTHGS